MSQRTLAFAAVLGLWASMALPAAAQDAPPLVLDSVQSLDFDRPESWAMKYFTAVSAMTGMGPAAARRPGAFELALEGALVPNLGEEKRRVGFLGDKVEDLNRTRLFGRLRASVGLPGGLSFTVGLTPPAELDGITPKLVSFELARPIRQTRRWRLSLGLLGQIGTIEGDITCPAAIAGLDDPGLNPDGCLEPSNDEVSQDYLGLELAAGRLSAGAWAPYASLLVTRMDLAFQVDAVLPGIEDRTRLETEGTTWAATLGSAYRLSPEASLRGELFYSPLEVVRDATRGAQTDELVNLRLLVSWAWR